jgi:hypothetical protein
MIPSLRKGDSDGDGNEQCATHGRREVLRLEAGWDVLTFEP